MGVILCCVCGSLYVGGQCRNESCGKPKHTPKRTEVNPNLSKALRHGMSLITAQRDPIGSLGGPALGLYKTISVAKEAIEMEHEKAAAGNVISKEAFLAKVAEIGDKPGRANLLAEHFHIKESQVYILYNKFDVPKRILDRGKTAVKQPVKPFINKEFDNLLPRDLPKSPPTEANTNLPVSYDSPSIRVPEFDPAHCHRALCVNLHDTWADKNADYGDSFHISFRQFGVVSALTRISDKWNKVVALSTNPAKAKTEIIEDTLADMANYCLMTIMELRRSQKGE